MRASQRLILHNFMPHICKIHLNMNLYNLDLNFFSQCIWKNDVGSSYEIKRERFFLFTMINIEGLLLSVYLQIGVNQSTIETIAMYLKECYISMWWVSNYRQISKWRSNKGYRILVLINWQGNFELWEIQTPVKVPQLYLRHEL